MRSLRPDDLDVLALEQLVVGEVDDSFERLPTASALEMAIHHADVPVPCRRGAGIPPPRIGECVNPVHDLKQRWGDKKRLSGAEAKVKLQDGPDLVRVVLL